MERHGVDSLIAIGGEGTLAAAKRLTDAGIKIVGVPKTIDNDLSATDYTFGFDTAVQIATEAMDRLRTTGDSHGRCMVAEVMGRHVGWIALHSGMAAGAHAILIPEQKTSMDQICDWVQSARDRGRAPLIVVAEGFKLDTMDDAHSERGLDAFGRPRLGGIGDLLAPEIEARTGIETRATTLGHIQRGGTPTAYDRVLATRYGMAARRRRAWTSTGAAWSPCSGTHIMHVAVRGRARQAQDGAAVPLRRGRHPLRLTARCCCRTGSVGRMVRALRVTREGSAPVRAESTG